MRANRSKAPRKPMGYFDAFNEWFRNETEANGTKPDGEEVERWLNTHGETVWPDSAERPCIQELKHHVYRLRSKAEIREYFREYRSKRKQQEAASQAQEQAMDGTPLSDDLSQEMQHGRPFKQQHQSRVSEALTSAHMLTLQNGLQQLWPCKGTPPPPEQRSRRSSYGQQLPAGLMLSRGSSDANNCAESHGDATSVLDSADVDGEEVFYNFLQDFVRTGSPCEVSDQPRQSTRLLEEDMFTPQEMAMQEQISQELQLRHTFSEVEKEIMLMEQQAAATASHSSKLNNHNADYHHRSQQVLSNMPLDTNGPPNLHYVKQESEYPCNQIATHSLNFARCMQLSPQHQSPQRRSPQPGAVNCSRSPNMSNLGPNLPHNLDIKAMPEGMKAVIQACPRDWEVKVEGGSVVVVPRKFL